MRSRNADRRNRRGSPRRSRHRSPCVLALARTGPESQDLPLGSSTRHRLARTRSMPERGPRSRLGSQLGIRRQRSPFGRGPPHSSRRIPDRRAERDTHHRATRTRHHRRRSPCPRSSPRSRCGRRRRTLPANGFPVAARVLAAPGQVCLAHAAFGFITGGGCVHRASGPKNEYQCEFSTHGSPSAEVRQVAVRRTPTSNEGANDGEFGVARVFSSERTRASTPATGAAAPPTRRVAMWRVVWPPASSTLFEPEPRSKAFHTRLVMNVWKPRKRGWVRLEITDQDAS